MTSISESAFEDCSSLTSVTIPDSVTSICDYAFGYYYDNYNANKLKDFKMYCYSNTAGEQYAKDNGFEYELLDHRKDHAVQLMEQYADSQDQEVSQCCKSKYKTGIGGKSMPVFCGGKQCADLSSAYKIGESVGGSPNSTFTEGIVSGSDGEIEKLHCRRGEPLCA